MGDLDAKFRAYSHDPGLIARDVVEKIYIPYAEEIRDTQTGVIDSIKDGRDYMLRLNGSLEAVDDAFEYLIDATLPEFREQMAENVQGIRDVVNQYSKWIEESVLPPLDVSIKVLEDRADVLERSNAVARAKLDNPIEIFMATEFQDRETQLATYRYLEQMVKAGTDAEQRAFSLTTEMGRDELIEATAKVILETKAPWFMELEAPTGRLPAPTPASGLTSWNVGEY